MAANKLSTEAIALTEKKMDMTLDDIIKMSKKAPFKGKQASRTSNKSQGFLIDRVAQRNAKVQRFMNSRSAIRQGVLAQRRTNFKGNQFPVTTEVARKAAVVPIRNRAINSSKQRFAAVPIRTNAGDGNFAGKKQTVNNNKQRPKTLDALFAGMKEQRMKTISQQMGRGRGQSGQRRGRQNQQQRGWNGAANAGSGARYGGQFGNFGR